MSSVRSLGIKRFSAEQILTSLRQIGVLMAQGKSPLGGLPRCGHIAAELRDEQINDEILYSLKEAQTVIEQWPKYCDTVRPYSS